MPSAASTAKAPRPWRVRFTLRMLLVAVTMICVGLAIWTRRAHEQKSVVARIRLNSCVVYYDYHLASIWPKGPQGSSPLPAWLLDPLGEDFFHRVVAVDVEDPDALADVARLDRVERVMIANSGVNDDDVHKLIHLGRLRELVIRPSLSRGIRSQRPTRLTDRSLEAISAMPALNKVTLHGDAFTGSGLTHLADSWSLREIEIHGCDNALLAADADPLRANGRIEHFSITRPQARLNMDPRYGNTLIVEVEVVASW